MQSLIRYVQQSGSELRKVTWPSRRNAIKMSFAVVVFSIILGTAIGLIDFAFTRALQTIILKG